MTKKEHLKKPLILGVIFTLLTLFMVCSCSKDNTRPIPPTPSPDPLIYIAGREYNAGHHLTRSSSKQNGKVIMVSHSGYYTYQANPLDTLYLVVVDSVQQKSVQYRATEKREGKWYKYYDRYLNSSGKYTKSSQNNIKRYTNISELRIDSVKGKITMYQDYRKDKPVHIEIKKISH